MDVELFDETRVIPHSSEKIVSLPDLPSDLNDGYSVRYRVKLMDDLFISIPRNENVIIAADQSNIVFESPDFHFESSFFILRNGSRQTISLRKDKKNSETIEYILPIVRFNRYTFIPAYDSSPYIKPDDQRLYDPLVASPNAFLIEADQYKTIPFSIDHVSPGFVYAFTFDGAAVRLTDARPLTKIGEPGWAKTIDSSEPLRILAGTETALPSNTFAVTGTAQTASGAVFVSGYQYISDTEYTPIVQLQNNNGVLINALGPSTKQDRRQAYFLSMAKDDGAIYLAAGGADSGRNTGGAYIAYVRAIRDEASRVTSLWELGPAEFENYGKQNNIRAQCGAVNSAVYSSTRNRWLITGNTIEYDALGNPVKGSYLAEINDVNGQGVIQKIDTSFKNISFYKIAGGENGAYYIAGEEEKADGVYALVFKFDAGGKQLWRQRNQPRPNSFYQDAVLDAENGQIVLAGTMNAKAESGAGGTPFAEGIGIDTGALIWREEFNTEPLRGTSLVTGIEKAPGYGFVLSLCGIANNYYAKPFILARVNARGKLGGN
jgi:hypothetical protein